MDSADDFLILEHKSDNTVHRSAKHNALHPIALRFGADNADNGRTVFLLRNV